MAAFCSFLAMAPDWLSPEDYQRLSPAERQELWAERKLAGHRRRFGTPRRRGRGLWRFAPLWGAAIVIGVGVGAGWSHIEQAIALAPIQAVAPTGSSAGERVYFRTCVWGGGTNCVVDGDTFYLHGEKIRIAGIDAPETHDFKCPAEKRLGDRSTARPQELLNRGLITLSQIDRNRDTYGRLLRNVAVNGEDVGDTLISEGLAREYQGYKKGWC